MEAEILRLFISLILPTLSLGFFNSLQIAPKPADSLNFLAVFPFNNVYAAVHSDSAKQRNSSGLKFISPTAVYCSKAVISSGYGYRKLDGKLNFHDGVDIANHGKGCLLNPIYPGTVSNLNQAYGNTIVIKHEQGFTSIYGHNAAIYSKINAKVGYQSKISQMGSTGYAFGIHVHLRIDKSGAAKDPKGNTSVNPALYIKL